MPSSFIAIILLLSCHPAKKKLFDDLVNRPAVTIYLSTYSLIHAPEEIGCLTNTTHLYIAADSMQGWTVHPPMRVSELKKAIPGITINVDVIKIQE